MVFAGKIFTAAAQFFILLCQSGYCSYYINLFFSAGIKGVYLSPLERSNK
jgi:hypothetical protein